MNNKIKEASKKINLLINKYKDDLDKGILKEELHYDCIMDVEKELKKFDDWEHIQEIIELMPSCTYKQYWEWRLISDIADDWNLLNVDEEYKEEDEDDDE